MIKREAERLAASSVYRYGDAGSFSVPVCSGVDLPGSESPLLYLDMVGCQTVSGRVLVLAPGNGGLAAACLARGAGEVVVVEYRARFQGPVDVVLALVAKGRHQVDQKDTHYRSLDSFPGGEDWSESLGKFDLVLWAEGVDEVTEPKRVLKGVASCLAPGGKVVMEVYHGNNEWVEQINSWRPTGDAMLRAAQESFGGVWTGKLPARRANGRIYTLTSKQKKAEKKAVPPKPAAKKVAPKSPAPKKMTPPKKEEAPKTVPPLKKIEAPAEKETKKEKAPPPPAPKAKEKDKGDEEKSSS